MKNEQVKNWLLIAFVLLCLVHVGLRYAQIIELANSTKAMLMPLLLAAVIVDKRAIHQKIKKYLIMALTCSWLGDVILIWSDTSELYFILGLVFFLIAHIFYINIFRLLVRYTGDKRKLHLIALIFIVIFIFAMLSYLYKSTPSSIFPAIVVYAMVIGAMAYCSLFLLQESTRSSGIIIVLGALMFVSSDAVLAITTFGASSIATNQADVMIMSTYCAAQLLLTLGIVEFDLRRKYFQVDTQ